MQSFYFQGNTHFPSQGWLALNGKGSSRSAPGGTSPHGVIFTWQHGYAAWCSSAQKSAFSQIYKASERQDFEELPELMFYVFALLNEKCKPNTFSAGTNHRRFQQIVRSSGRCRPGAQDTTAVSFTRSCWNIARGILIWFNLMCWAAQWQIGPAVRSEFTCCSFPVLQHSGRQGKPGRSQAACPTSLHVANTARPTTQHGKGERGCGMAERRLCAPQLLPRMVCESRCVPARLLCLYILLLKSAAAHGGIFSGSLCCALGIIKCKLGHR